MEGSLTAWDEAALELEQLASTLDTGGARLLLAQVHLDRHRLADARREAERAIALDPTRADAYVLLGRIHLKASQPELAVNAYGEATRTEPNRALNFYQLSSAFASLGRITDATSARQDFVTAAERRLDAVWGAAGSRLSDATRTRLLEGRSQFFTRQAPVDYLASAAAGLTAFLPARYEIAARHFREGAYAEAVAALREAVSSDPLTRGIPDLGTDPAHHLETARTAASASVADAENQVFWDTS